jgi:hypothetical protein
VDSNIAAYGHCWPWLLSIVIPIAFALLIACIPFDDAAAQICTVSSSSVTLGSGSCSISPNTTLNGSPAVHATTNATITTNNVTVNPTNGGSTGGLAETKGTIIFSAGSSINGNWATAASAQTGGVIIFESGSAINPAFGGGGTALIANGTGGGQTDSTGIVRTIARAIVFSPPHLWTNNWRGLARLRRPRFVESNGSRAGQGSSPARALRRSQKAPMLQAGGSHPQALDRVPRRIAAMADDRPARP